MLTPEESVKTTGGGVKSAITPPAGCDFGLFPQEYLIGSWRSVMRETDLKKIDSSKFRLGMRVYVFETKEEWELTETGFVKLPQMNYELILQMLRQRAILEVAEHIEDRRWAVRRVLDKNLPYTVYWGNAPIFESSAQCVVTVDETAGATFIVLNLDFEPGLVVRLQGFKQ